MAHGGARKGAGRKKGSLTRRTQEIVAAAVNEGLTPLEHMLNVLRDPSADEKRRDAMAIAAAQFMHPKLSAVEAKVDADVEMAVTHIELVAPDLDQDDEHATH